MMHVFSIIRNSKHSHGRWEVDHSEDSRIDVCKISVCAQCSKSIKKLNTKNATLQMAISYFIIGTNQNFVFGLKDDEHMLRKHKSKKQQTNQPDDQYWFPHWQRF